MKAVLRIKEAFRSTLGQKYLTSITGVGLVIFIIFHLISNLALLNPNPAVYNSLSNSLVELGGLLVIAEVVLLAFIAIHILVAVNLKLISLRARPQSYVCKRTKHRPSKLGFSSTGLFLTGSVILIFIVVHVLQFKFGPNVSEGYSVSVRRFGRRRDSVSAKCAKHVFLTIKMSRARFRPTWIRFRKLGFLDAL